MIAFGWALLVSGCGVWELWKSNEPADTGAMAVQRRCRAGIDAFCTCREAANLSPCTDAQLSDLETRCIADEVPLVEFLECHRDLVDTAGNIRCLETAQCGALPEDES